jgi:hypothetical protein
VTLSMNDLVEGGWACWSTLIGIVAAILRLRR